MSIKKLIPLCFVLFFAISDGLLAANENVKILSFNILLSKADRYIAKARSWANRQEGVVAVIREGKYDFIGLQEVIYNADFSVSQEKYLLEKFPDYGMLGRAREEKADDGEGTPIMYRKDRWEPDTQEQGVFWLSDTPGVSSITWLGHHPRTVVWARFHELENGKRTGRAIYFFNTHYTYVAESAKLKSSIQIAAFIAARKHSNESVFLTGDLNSAETAPSMKYLRGEKVEQEGKTVVSPCQLIDVYRKLNSNTSEKDKTAHAYKTNSAEWSRIDYIYVIGNAKPVSARVLRTANASGLYPSDHFPVEAVFEMK